MSEKRCVRGSYMGIALPQRDIPLLLGLHRQGKLPIDRLITRLSDEAVLRQLLRPHA